MRADIGAEGFLVSDNINTDGTEAPEDPPIVVTGTRPREFYPGTGGDPGTGTPGDTGGSGGGGGSSGPSGPRQVANHSEDCASEDSAAADVARKVKGEVPPGFDGPADPLVSDQGFTWHDVEFGSIIIGTGGGRFGALNDAIYSNNEPKFVTLPSGAGSDVRGVWHNHIRQGTAQELSFGRYPSVYPGGGGDWAGLQALADKTGNPNPSLWLTGPDSITREFKLSEREYYQSLTDAQREQGVGLEGKERNEACG